MTLEEQARQRIDALLSRCGWAAQPRSAVNLAAGRGVAVAELPFGEGEPDYTLFVDGRAIGTVEAKPEGFSLTGVEEQSAKYIRSVPGALPAWRTPLPFSYESTGTETRFTNHLDPEPRSRSVFAFHRPETLLEWVQEDRPLNQRLREYPPLDTTRLWKAQVTAITNLEASLAANRPRALIQMATGSGKTFTAVNFVYRLLKYAKARRVLFLVDRGNLGDQTRKEFQQFVSPVNNYKFTEEYIVQHLASNTLDTTARVTISTIQRLYSMLRGEAEPAPDLDDIGYEAAASLFKEPVPVDYNPAFPIETFDFIITDECHRSIYNLWRQVLEYFDAYQIGLTATPSKQTFGFFNQNLVMEYGHEDAVADSVNVGYDVYRIETQITAHGGKVEAGYHIDKRDRRTRQVRWEQLDEDLEYDAGQLDRDVVAPDQIRTVLATFRDKLFTEIFPGRSDVPKTLIFAKDDSHADDIVRICREVFDKGNDFCKKITYRTTGETPKNLIKAFRNSYNPRIAVTVDMIATGTDIKPLEIVFFMRSVKSRGFFEQMKGRGVRVIDEADMEQVNPGVKRKTHFVIVDAVGVCERDKTDSRPLDKKKHVPFDKLLEAVALGNREPAALESLASRLIRLEKRLDDPLREEIKTTAKGQSLSDLARDLLDSVNPDLKSRDGSATLDTVEEASRLFFDPSASVEELSGNLPHWRQEGVTYFVTFRLADALPREKLDDWRAEREQWLHAHPEPHDEVTRREYHQHFSDRIQRWLDAGHGSCVLALPQVKDIVEGALRHFAGQRYELDEFVVATNHVHVLVRPLGEHSLSQILHSWKSFTAHQILKVEEASRLLNQSRDGSATLPQSRDGSATEQRAVWQKESFDHIVRSPASLDKFRAYIRNHRAEEPSRLLSDVEAPSRLLSQQRRDAAAAPIATNPDLRNLLIRVQRAAEQVIDVISKDLVLYAGAAPQTVKNLAEMTKGFRAYLDEHRAEITALQILYSRPYRQRLTEPLLKELESKLRQSNAAWTEDRLWEAFAAARPEHVRGRSQAGRFADLVALVRFALEQQPVLEPFADSVQARFDAWLRAKEMQGAAFTPDQRAWLALIRDHIATSLSIEPEDFDYAPFSQQGGLGRAHQLFGDGLAGLLDELNEVLAA